MVNITTLIHDKFFSARWRYPVCEYAGRIAAGLGGGGGPSKDGTGKSGSRVESEVVEVKDLRLRRNDTASSTS